MENRELLSTVLKLILRRMEAGMYYDWGLGYNSDIDWWDEEPIFHDVRPQSRVGILRLVEDRTGMMVSIGPAGKRTGSAGRTIGGADG